MNKHLPAYIILALLIFYIALNELGYQVVHKTELPTIVEFSDTTYQAATKALHVNIPEPKVIVIDKHNQWQQEVIKTFGKLKVENELLAQINDSLINKLHVYSDTLSDENLDIYYNSLVHGNLLASDIEYTLKVPTVITHNKTNTVSVPTDRNQWLVQGEVGGNKTSFSNLSLGVGHISTKGFYKGYRYNFLQNTHNINLGYSLFKPMMGNNN